MQRRLRDIMVLACIALLIAIVSLIIIFLSDSLVLTIISCLLGLLMVVIAFSGITRVIIALSEVINTQATRLKNLETRVSGQDLSGLDEPLVELPSRVRAIEERQELANSHAIGLRKQLKVLRNRVPAGYMEPVQKSLGEIRAENKALLRSTFESALLLKRDPRSVLTTKQAHELFQDYLSQNRLLQLRPLIEHFDLLEDQRLSTLRMLYKFYRSTGYWELASKVIHQLKESSGLDTDANAALKLKHEVQVFSQPNAVTVDLPAASGYDPKGPIVHMVGRVLPETQTGYTLRTQYTALAQAKKGLPVVIVGQSGITKRGLESVEHYTFQGVNYYLLPGPVRNEIHLDEWLRANISELARLVESIRPSILHAQSDFFNALIVNVVGRAYGIPTVYEARGFWEYSWLSRTITANEWYNADTLFAMYGTPEAYEYRKNAEKVARSLPDHVFTLAEVMKEHILDSSDGDLLPETVSIVPNAVETESFPVQDKDHSLAEEIGIPEDVVTVGYISSMVEYEGIDTLIDAFASASESTQQPMALLLVGDGDYLPHLKQRVNSRGIANVHFPGRVPHETVLRYYGLIDLFVVPRKRSVVANLVTPLKPFEAFSTGRAVILSDVGALREIAEQSQAVEMFRADDSEDLAQKIIELVNNPSKRDELSRRAARWVRNNRTWDNNVNEYYRVYRNLGYQGPTNRVVESELSLLARDLNPGELVDSMAKAELPPLSGWFTIQDTEQSASSILKEGWRYASFEPVMLSRIEDWAEYGAQNRSWGFHLHSLECIDPMLREYDITGDIKWLNVANQVALDWVENHTLSSGTTDPMVWYDMSLALRMPRLIALALRSARLETHRDETVVLAAAIGRHFDELHLDRAFNPNNNHGFYTAVSQVHAAKYLPMFVEAETTAEQGRTRLIAMAFSQFADDGTHLEHSPDYHRMLLNSFERAINDNLIEDVEVEKRIERAAHVLGWMVQPDGTLVQLGDTPEYEVDNARPVPFDPETEYIVSDGAHGTPPANELAVFPSGGYAFVRSPQPKEPGTLHNSGYLAFSASFHSRAHKHADDLNVVWYERGQQILTDGGRFGYGELLAPESPLRREGFYYTSSERQYLEGTMAHNTLMMDGKNQERRRRKPYGSGLGECFQADGVFDLTGRVQHLDYVHRRRVIYRPGRELLLKDAVYSQSPEEREAIIWLNISGHFELESVADALIFVSHVDEKPTTIRVDGPGHLIDPVRGRENPMRGWRSRHDRSLEPVWSVGFKFSIETRASVATRIQFLD